jgi:nucleotide-binding universal stress UspA family protein
MIEGGEENTIRRIVVALDASPHSLAALRAAAELAALLDAELIGVFVEDINLVNLAGLPAARQVSFYSATTRQFGRQQVEEELRAQANRARRALAAASQWSGIRSSFRVIRGVIENELLSIAKDADLVIMGKAGWSHRRRLGSTTRILISQSPCQTLIIQQGTRMGFVLGLLYDGSPASGRALQSATRLLQSRHGFLTILLLADEIEQARQMQSQVTHWLRERHLSARFRWLLGSAAKSLASIVKGEGYGALVVPSDMQTLTSEELADLLDEVEAPVLVVR